MATPRDLWTKTNPAFDSTKPATDPKVPGIGSNPRRLPTPEYGKGKRWAAEYREPTGVKRQYRFTLKESAAAKLAEVAKAKNDGLFVGRNRVTVEAFIEQWAASQLQWRSTSAETNGHRAKLVTAALGHHLLAEVAPEHVQAAVTGWHTEGYSASYIADLYGVTKTVFAAAVTARKVAITPCVGVKLPRVNHVSDLVPLTSSQVLALAEAVNPRFRALVLLAASTGLRFMELAGLTVDPMTLRFHGGGVDIHLARQLSKDSRASSPVWAPLKTRASKRVIHCGPDVSALLRRHMAEYAPGSGGLLFTTRTGGPLNPGGMFTVLARTAARAGVVFDGSWHQFRHYHVSILIAAGHNVVEIAKRIGHGRVSETLDTYSHLFPNASNDRIIGTVSSALFAAPADAAAPALRVVR